MKQTFISIFITAMLAGCASMAPDYQRPEAPVASEWGQGANQGERNAADIGWREFFVDERLRKLIELSLANNRDLRIAALNIEQARAEYRIQRADLFPTVNAGGSVSVQRNASGARSGSVDSTTGTSTTTGGGSGNSSDVTRNYRASVGLSAYELDFFGRVRSLNEQALQLYFATEEARRATQISLVSEIANAWLTLAADKERLRLAQETFASQKQSYELTRRRFELGVASELDVRQAQTTMDTAQVDVARYTTLIRQDENALTLLAGAQVPEELKPQGDVEVTALAEIPAGLPSQVLQNRPDVLQAERQLMAANANIGAARAAFFPTISLTATIGTASNELSGLFAGGSGFWSFVPQITVPIFNAGRNKANLEVAELQKDINIAQYEKAIQAAFREVADALALKATVDEQLAAQKSLVDATDVSYRLAEARFNSGIDSFLTVLDSQRAMYASQQNLITLRLTLLNNQVTLYRALGGGWKE
jgi:multidrug efflux system outer membrane protein